MYPGISFTSLFLSDITDPSVYSRGTIPLNRLISQGEKLIIRVEDCVVDNSVCAVKAIERNASPMLVYNRLYNTLSNYRKSDRTENIKDAPVFYPMYAFLTAAKKLEYPVTLVYEHKELIREHPLFQLLDLKTLPLWELHESSQGNFLSPYAEDHPDYLFPRNFNKGVMDEVYTVKLSV